MMMMMTEDEAREEMFAETLQALNWVNERLEYINNCRNTKKSIEIRALIKDVDAEIQAIREELEASGLREISGLERILA